jgi:hypothetical protein
VDWSSVGIDWARIQRSPQMPEKTKTEKLKINLCGCGGEGYRKTVECGGFDSLESGTIACKKCGAQGPTLTTSWADITRAWNQAKPLRS